MGHICSSETAVSVVIVCPLERASGAPFAVRPSYPCAWVYPKGEFRPSVMPLRPLNNLVVVVFVGLA